MDELHSKHTIDDLFKRAIEIERKAGDVYKELARLFSHKPEVAAFWIDLRKDELSHMQTLKNICNSLKEEQLVAVSDEQIFRMLIKVENRFNEDVIGPIKNLDDAYELAHDMENSEMNAIFQFLADNFVPFNERSKFVIANIQDHQKKLLDFGQTIGDRVWRTNIQNADKRVKG